jgi:inward rectifier potassium channel
LAGDAIHGASPGSYLDAFFFSVQTMATVGSGQLYPIGAFANALASLEAFFGLLGFAVAAALVFAKLARPTAKILFSKKAVVHLRDGQKSLVFRVANERNNQILEASLSATLVQTSVTLEGETVRKMSDLRLLRQRTPVFALTWTAVHPLDEASPLYGKSIADLQGGDAEIIVAFTGLDDAFSAAVHARHSYIWDEIEWDRRLEDIISRGESGEVTLDFRKFHLTREL